MRFIVLLRPALCAALAVIVLQAFVPPTVTACPFCDGDQTGVNEVKAGIFNECFWPRVAAILAPFPVLAGIVALIYFGLPGFFCAPNRPTDSAGPYGG